MLGQNCRFLSGVDTDSSVHYEVVISFSLLNNNALRLSCDWKFINVGLDEGMHPKGETMHSANTKLQVEDLYSFKTFCKRVLVCFIYLFS